MSEAPDALPTDLTEQVAAFHHKFGIPVRSVPMRLSEIPAIEVEYRLRRMAEDFCNAMRAFGLSMGGSEKVIGAEITAVFTRRAYGGRVDEIARVLADVDYTVEGTRLTLGVPRASVAAEVHRANMNKVHAVPVAPAPGPGWKAPEIKELFAREAAASTE